ncbi:MAG TPA: cytochrome c3 family protein [Kofleriaceae bacterium]|jgi:predicted CXXCH cytochrome family protein
MRLAVVSVLIVVACGGTTAPSREPAKAPPPVVTSNVLREDYAGSRACSDCHSAIYQTWESSPMRNMTRDAATATIRAPFDGASLRVGGDTAVMETVDGKRMVRVTTADGTLERFTVTKVVGGRYREDFVGTDERGFERVLPATYVFATKSWRYKGYSVMVKERPAMGTTGRWSQECLPCHNTLPLATMYYDDLDPVVPSYQGKLSDRVMPPAKQWHAKTLDPDGLVQALEAEIAYLGGDAPKVANAHESLVAAAVAAEAHLDGPHLVELGVGCEACHNGAKVHAAEPATKPTFAVATGLFGVTPPVGETGTNAQWINHTCAKCHTVLFSRYPWTWEGGNRRKNPGGSSISSGEGRDYQLGACQSKMACTQCHDPHTMDSREKLEAMATPAGNTTCTGCHPQYAAADALKAHAHHDPAGAGASCIGCHMPKKNMGLDYALIRYHRIGNPDDPKRVEADRPVECALCHADKSVDQLVTTMEGWWGKHYDRAALHQLYGDDLSVNALRATLFRGKAHEQAVAIAVFGQAKQQDAVPAIVEQLTNEYPLVRYYAQRALQTITGDPVAIDVGAPAADVRVKAAAWLAAWTAKH